MFLFVANLPYNFSTFEHMVLQGLDFMVDYRLTHSFLNSVLPKLCSLFHDKTEKVRLAVADLLLKIKRLQIIKVGLRCYAVVGLVIFKNCILGLNLLSIVTDLI